MVSINLSAVQFRHRLLVERLAQVLADTGIARHRSSSS